MPPQDHLAPPAVGVALRGNGKPRGINRTAGQIYALIFISPKALNADAIAEPLEFWRCAVSMGLEELQSWRLLRLKHLGGDRRE